MKITHQAWLLSLMLLIAPLSVVWGTEQSNANPQIANTKSKVTLDAATKAAKQAVQIQKEKLALRKAIQAQKKNKNKRKNFTKSQYKASKQFTKKNQYKSNSARHTAKLPEHLSIRTWSYPETNNERSDKIPELKTRITQAENSYDAEMAHYEKLSKAYNYIKENLTASQTTLEQIMEPQIRALDNFRQAQAQAMNNPQISTEPQRREYLRIVAQTSKRSMDTSKSIDTNSQKLASLGTRMTASKSRLNDIMAQLDALHQHRTEVTDVVFLRTVSD